MRLWAVVVLVAGLGFAPWAASAQPIAGFSSPLAPVLPVVGLPSPELPALSGLTPIPAPSAPDGGPWFYSGLDYGSESLVHPLRMIINGGFGILQFDNRDNRLGRVNFSAGWKRVTTDLAHPVRAIELEGWNDFLMREVVPMSFDRRQARYWPNYTLHLIGGGMSYTMMSEWFGQKGYQRPQWWAGGTLAIYHMLNEVVENEEVQGPTTDAIADIYIFDGAAVLLFSHESVNRFFSRRLHMRDWSLQPAIDLGRGTIENQGQNFSIKVPIPNTARWSFFYYFGNHGEGGLTYTRPNGSAVSVAGGFRASALVDAGDHGSTADLVPSFGLFYDRNGSLLFSVTGARSSRYALTVNIYPGLLRVRGVTAGLFVARNEDGRTTMGIHLPLFPVGAAAQR